MYNKQTINKVRKLGQSGIPRREIGRRYHIPESSVRYILKNDYERVKRKPGPKFKVTKRQETRIKRKVASLLSQNKKVNARIIKNSCDLSVSTRTTRTHLRRMGYQYTNIDKSIPLTKVHKKKRVDLANQWLGSNHNFKKTVFSDEKRFSYDGPDNWQTWTDNRTRITRSKRQMGGGSIMVWGMLLPDGLIHLELMKGRQNSEKYLSLIKDKVKPFLDSRFENNDYWFQQDNCSIHCAKIVKNWIAKNNFRILEWPSRSPDFNIIENVWKMMEDYVYDGHQFSNGEELWTKVLESAEYLMSEKRPQLVSLFEGMNKRLLDAINSKGEITNH